MQAHPLRKLLGTVIGPRRLDRRLLGKNALIISASLLHRNLITSCGALAIRLDSRIRMGAITNRQAQNIILLVGSVSPRHFTVLSSVFEVSYE